LEINKLHTFLLSFKLNGKVQVHTIEAINLRHAKEKILFSHDDATDIRDWTNEKKRELQKYINKNNLAVDKEQKSAV
jgi:hypothetical protein